LLQRRVSSQSSLDCMCSGDVYHRQSRLQIEMTLARLGTVAWPIRVMARLVALTLLTLRLQDLQDNA